MLGQSRIQNQVLKPGTQSSKIVLLIIIILVIIYLFNLGFKGKDENNKMKIEYQYIVLASILLSFTILLIDKFINISFFYDKNDKDKIDYRKFVFIFVYLALVLQSGFLLNTEITIPQNMKYLPKRLQWIQGKSQKINIRYLIITIIISNLIFTIFSSNTNKSFIKTEYYFYNLYIFSFIFVITNFIRNIKIFENINNYLIIMTLLGSIIFLFKPLVEILDSEIGNKNISEIKYSNYYYFNKNIIDYDEDKNYNKRFFNTLMSYIIISIILFTFYIGFASIFKTYV